MCYNVNIELYVKNYDVFGYKIELIKLPKFLMSADIMDEIDELI